MMNVINAVVRRVKMRRDPIGYARSLGVRIGDDCRIDLATDTFSTEPYLITIGNHVTIAPGVKFMNHDGGVWVFRKEYPEIDVVAPIVICDNVFLGMYSIILPGVTIGANSVIGAGAVVTRDIEPGSVAVGIPARRIKSIDEYWESVSQKSVMIRNLSPIEKRRFLEARFLGTPGAKGATSHE